MERHSTSTGPTATLDTVTKDWFAGREGKSVTVTATEGELGLEIVQVKENPRSACPQSTRMPFSVLLRGPGSPCLADGGYGLRIDGESGWRLEGVHLNRIMPPTGLYDEDAYYQMVFC